MSLIIAKGDITKYVGDAIVNAANKSLLGGGGVDGAIHRVAGPDLLIECRTLNGCETGEAKITKGYRLPARYVIHTVGPIYSEKRKELCEQQLRNCYKNSLELARTKECVRIAFPLISAGVYGYPKKEALQIAVETILQYGEDMDVSIILFDAEIVGIAQNEFKEYCQF